MNHLTEISISCGLILVAWIQIVRLRRESFRFDIRSLRDELFGFVHQNGLSFQDPGYLAVRRSLNGLLNRSNRISVFLFVGAMYFCELKRKNGYDTIDLAKSANALLSEKLDDIRYRAADRLVHFFFLEGVFGCLVRSVYVIAMACAKSAQLKRSVFSYADQLFCQSYIFTPPTDSSIHYGCRSG